MHRVEAHAAAKLTGPELVAVLMKAQSQLDDLPEAKRLYWSSVLHDLLEGCPHGRLRDEAVAQAILRNLLNELYNARDTKFTNLATQQNKVTWLVFTGLVILAALISQGYEDLLLAGAVGGVLSRLQRELHAARRAERLRALVVGAVPVAGVRRAVGLGRPAAAAVAAALQRDRSRAAAARRHGPDRAVGSDPRASRSCSGSPSGCSTGSSARPRTRSRPSRPDDKTLEPTVEPPRQPAPARQAGVVGP